LFFSIEVLKKIAELINQRTGISIKEEKYDLLKNKVEKFISVYGFKSCESLYEYLLCNKEGFLHDQFINYITVNKTEFLREKIQFDFLAENFSKINKTNERISKNSEVRIWSSACSFGSEAYTIAITLKEHWPENIDIKILATDISTKALNKAIEGCYTIDEINVLGNNIIEKYFANKKGLYFVKDEIRQMITFRKFNLMENFCFSKGFDIVFCRNVMIYFSNETQQKLIKKFYEVIVDGGMLFIGLSECILNKENKFKYLGNSIYVK